MAAEVQSTFRRKQHQIVKMLKTLYCKGGKTSGNFYIRSFVRRHSIRGCYRKVCRSTVYFAKEALLFENFIHFASKQNQILTTSLQEIRQLIVSSCDTK